VTVARFSAQPTDTGLYRREHEHDACGVALVATMRGSAGHDIVAHALDALRNLDHRGATGADPLVGDGAGILTQVPDAFFRDETLDLSDLKVNADTYLDGILSASDKSITDYSLTWADGGASVADGDRLTLVGDNQTIVVTKEGYTSASFDISVSAITGFTQSLKVTSATKTSYAVNAALDLSGMVVQLYTSYKDDSNQKHTSSTTVDSKDYTVTIVDPTSTSTVLKTSYSLASYGTYTITISTKGWKLLLSALQSRKTYWRGRVSICFRNLLHQMPDHSTRVPHLHPIAVL
jgi:hypothetical protein